MSRVFSRRPGRRLLLRCRVSDSSGAADRVLEMREMPRQRFALGKFARPARKLSIRPSRAGLLSITVEPNATARTARTTKTARKWALVPLPANALLRLPVSAFLALFLQTWPMKCLLSPPCCGHASCSPCLRAWQPGTNRPWQPRPSSKDASEAGEGCPNARAAARP